MKMNRFISILLILSLTVSLAVLVSADNPISLQLGDTTGDGKINAADALEVLQYSVGKRQKFTAETTVSDVGGGSCMPMLKFDTVEEFQKWLESLQAPPEEYVLTGQTFFNYLQSGYQDMFLIDRFYLLPKLSGDLKLSFISVHPAEIAFVYKDAQGKEWWYDYRTIFDEEIGTSSSIVQEYNGVNYYINSEYGEATRKIAGYNANVTIEIPANGDFDMREIETAFSSFTRVNLPPLTQ